MGDLSANFSRWEFACKGTDCCEHSAPVHSGLVSMCESLRTHIGNVGFTPFSGFRCNRHNGHVGGSPRSQHRLGLAVDVHPPEGVSYEDLASAADMMFRCGGVNGLGFYPPGEWVFGGVHMDIGGRRAVWVSHNGVMVPFDEERDRGYVCGLTS